MRIGYRRTSTAEQVAGYEAQERDLKAAGCERIFGEQLSSVDAHRVKLEMAIDYCRDGDVLVVMKLDRLARSVADVIQIEARLKEKGASLQIIDPAMDTSTPAGRLTFNVLASIAQFEREVMLSRQREGIAAAKRDKAYWGRKPTSRAKADDVKALAAQGQTRQAIADELHISVRSVYHILKDGDEVTKEYKCLADRWDSRNLGREVES